MTKEAQFRACAKLDNWVQSEDNRLAAACWEKVTGENLLTDMFGSPNYDERDVLIPLIRIWATTVNLYNVVTPDKERMERFTSFLYEDYTGEGDIDLSDVYDNNHRCIAFVLLTSSAARLRKALLQAAGVWKE